MLCTYVPQVQQRSEGDTLDRGVLLAPRAEVAVLPRADHHPQRVLSGDDMAGDIEGGVHHTGIELALWAHGLSHVRPLRIGPSSSQAQKTDCL